MHIYDFYADFSDFSLTLAEYSLFLYLNDVVFGNVVKNMHSKVVGMRNSKIDKIILKNMAKGEPLYNAGFSLTKWGAENNQFEVMEVGSKMMDKALMVERSN